MLFPASSSPYEWDCDGEEATRAMRSLPIDTSRPHSIVLPTPVSTALKKDAGCPLYEPPPAPKRINWKKNNVLFPHIIEAANLCMAARRRHPCRTLTFG